MLLSEALTELKSALEGDTGVPDVWEDTELEFLLHTALSRVNSARPRSLRDVITMVTGTEEYALENVYTVNRVDWLDADEKAIMQMPSRGWEVWGDNESLSQTLWVNSAYARDNYSIRVHGYAPWVWNPPGTGVTGVATTDIITVTAHGWVVGNTVQFTVLAGGTGLVINTTYYVRDVTTNTFKLAATLGGTAINFTTDITSGTIATTASFPYEVQQMIMTVARAEALRRLSGERARFRQWATSNPRSDVSVTELLAITNETDSHARELLQTLRIIKKPVVGRR